MIPPQQFYCPKCGAPGQVELGQATYSCVCRYGTYTAPETRDTWPRCPNCKQPIYFNHSCATVTCSTQETPVECGIRTPKKCEHCGWVGVFHHPQCVTQVPV